MGSEWGLGPLRIGSINSRRFGDRLVRREQAPEGEGSLATRRSARADERRPAAAPAEWSKTRAGRASRRPRTRAPHGEARSEKTGGPRRGLQGPRRALPSHLAARALGPDQDRRGQADGFGRYLRPAGACEFYLEYDRGTEAFGALSRKLEGYLKLAAGWTKEQELTGYPNLLIIVPEEVREGEVGSALRHAIGSLHVSGSLATSFPLYVASGEQLTELGVLGAAWKHLPTDGDRLSFDDLPAQPRDLYRASRCLGRYFTDERARRRISPVSTTPRFTALPRHAP
jgi:Replication-relaxation